MKKLITIMLALSTLMFALSCSNNITDGNSSPPPPPQIVYSDPWEGNSSKPRMEAGVYIITEGAHLAWLADQTTIITEGIRFDANIDMNDKLFKGIVEFNGDMYGNGKRIKKLTIDKTPDPHATAGLIQMMSGGSIKNLTIESGTIKGSAETGAFVGMVTVAVNITDVINKANVYGSDVGNGIGGIIGHVNADVTIKNAQNFGNISGRLCGGIIGLSTSISTKVTIKNVGNSGNISGNGSGSIIGSIIYDSTIENAYNYKSDINMMGPGNATITSSYTLNSSDSDIGEELKYLTADGFTKQSSFVGWDFVNIWRMGTLYPELK